MSAFAAPIAEQIWNDKYRFSTDRESTVEDSVVAWAENHGWIARPMSQRTERARERVTIRAGEVAYARCRAQ